MERPFDDIEGTEGAMTTQPPNLPPARDENSPPRSPIRPQHPDQAHARPSTARPVKPISPRSTSEIAALSTTPDPDPAKQVQQVEQALQELRDKMKAVAEEYAAGKLNQAQFNALYRRYSEQREITERLLERNPESDAWKSVIRSGNTAFLRDHFSAKIISYGIYHLADGQNIVLNGQVRLPQHQLAPILEKLRTIIQQGHTLGAAWRQLKDESWVFIVPAKYSLAVVIFSLEPSLIQRKMVEDLHQDFERANEKALQAGLTAPSQLVFPHRALLGS
jgi:hypothetical protein